MNKDIYRVGMNSDMNTEGMTTRDMLLYELTILGAQTNRHIFQNATLEQLLGLRDGMVKLYHLEPVADEDLV